MDWLIACQITTVAMVTKCRSCNAVFSIADQLALADRSTPVARSKAPQPKEFIVEHPDGALRMSWRWFTPISILPVAVALFWFSFMHSWVMDVGIIIPAVVGIGMSYVSLTAFVNTTRVEVSFHALSVCSGPLPTITNLSFLRQFNQFYGPLPASENLSLSRDSIRQLYCVERRHHVKQNTTISYELQAIKADGSSIAIIKNLKNIEQALYLEQQVECFLGIRDEPVRGEIQGYVSCTKAR
jgi:hypothetical protein